jgi:hypothetical protein
MQNAARPKGIARGRLPPVEQGPNGEVVYVQRGKGAGAGGYQWVSHFTCAGHVGCKDGGTLEDEWEEAEESVQRLEARMREFIRQLDTGRLQNRAARKLTNDSGEEVVRCRCTGSFGRQIMLVPIGSTLPRILEQISREVALVTQPGVDPELEMRYIDTDGEAIDIKSEAVLRSVIADARARVDETLAIHVVTRLDREREAAAAAAALAEKEREEAEAAEAAARRELEEAEEAERAAQEARAAAIAAKMSHSKEEREAEEAERIAEELRKVRQGTEARLGEASQMVRHLQALVAEKEAAGEEGAGEVEAVGGGGGGRGGWSMLKKQLAEAVAAENERKQALEKAQAEYAAAREDAERERREADEARKALEEERSRAEEMERVAAKERAEAEEAMALALKEREEYEAARASDERAQADLQRVLELHGKQKGGPEGAGGEMDEDREERERLEREERERQKKEEQERRRMNCAAELLQCNVRMLQARKNVRYRCNTASFSARGLGSCGWGKGQGGKGWCRGCAPNPDAIQILAPEPHPTFPTPKATIPSPEC